MVCSHCDSKNLGETIWKVSQTLQYSVGFKSTQIWVKAPSAGIWIHTQEVEATAVWELTCDSLIPQDAGPYSPCYKVKSTRSSFFADGGISACNLSWDLYRSKLKAKQKETIESKVLEILWLVSERNYLHFFLYEYF